MKTNLKKLSLLVVSILLTANQQSWAGGGTAVDGGGGMSYQGGLLDFAEAKQGAAGTPFVPAKLLEKSSELYRELTNKLSEPVENATGGLKLSVIRLREMNLVLSDFLRGNRKKFYFTVQPISAPGLVESNLNYLIKLDQKSKPVVVAYQNADSVIVNKTWFDSATELDRVGLIFHEFGIYLAMKFRQPHQNARELTRAFFAEQLGGNLDAIQLPSLVIDLGFGPILDERIARFVEELRKPVTNALISWAEVKDLSDKWITDRKTLELKREVAIYGNNRIRTLILKMAFFNEDFSYNFLSCFDVMAFQDREEYFGTVKKEKNLDQVFDSCYARTKRDMDAMSKYKLSKK